MSLQARVGVVRDGFDLDVSVGVRSGEILAVLGPNGAGKSTLLRALAGLLPVSSGQVRVDDERWDDAEASVFLPPAERRVGLVFQDYRLFPHLSVLDNVAFSRWVRGARRTDARAHARDVLARLAIGDLAGRRPAALSGGQAQRVALARALAAVRQGAGVVLLDEPTAQLDVRGEAEIFRRVLDATRGTTTILVSHRFSTVRLADRICVVEHGRVVELGSHDELMALRGRYRTMFDLQAERFDVPEGDEELTYDVL